MFGLAGDAGSWIRTDSRSVEFVFLKPYRDGSRGQAAGRGPMWHGPVPAFSLRIGAPPGEAKQEFPGLDRVKKVLQADGLCRFGRQRVCGCDVPVGSGKFLPVRHNDTSK